MQEHGWVWGDWHILIGILTASVNEVDERSAACRQSAEMILVYVRRLTDYHHADNKKCIISTFAMSLPDEHTPQMVFQCIEPVQGSMSVPVDQKLRTVRYRTVIRDQRCLCVNSLQKSSSHTRLCSPRQIQSIELLLIRVLLVSMSTYLLSRCQGWRIQQ
jgi:hypothetical protein